MELDWAGPISRSRSAFYEMLSGKPLFTGETAGEVLASVIKEQPKLDAVPAPARPLITLPS